MLFFVPFFFIIYLFFAGFFSFFIFFESHFSKKPPKRPMPAPNWHEQTLIVPFSLMLAKFKPALFPRVPSFFPFDTKANSWCHKRHDWKKKKIYISLILVLRGYSGKQDSITFSIHDPTSVLGNPTKPIRVAHYFLSFFSPFFDIYIYIFIIIAIREGPPWLPLGHIFWQFQASNNVDSLQQ